MNYLDHNKQYIEYLYAKKELQDVLDEWQVVFERTQPKVKYGEHTSGQSTNKVEEYVIEVERRHLHQRLEDAKMVLSAKVDLLAEAEAELRKSRNIYDLIYVKKWLDHKRAKDIYRELDFMGISYSKSHIYEIIKRIKANVRRDF